MKGIYVIAAIFLVAIAFSGAVKADLVPVGYWPLDDGQSDPNTTTAVDASTGGNNGTLLNFATPPSWAGGRTGGALKFDGKNDRVDMGNPDALDITGTLSMAFWMYRLGDGASSYGPLAGKNKSGGFANDGYWVGSYNDATLNSFIRFSIASTDGVGTSLDSISGIADEEWHHVAVVYDPAARMSIYIDGVLDAELTTDVPTEIQAVDSGFTLGNLATGSAMVSYSFNGLLDEVRVYDGVLTQKQIQMLAAGRDLLAGDANGDGIVNDADAVILAANWQGSGKIWSQGDFNNDGTVDAADATLLAANWQQAKTASVPEPTVQALLMTLLGTFAIRGSVMAVLCRRNTWNSSFGSADCSIQND